MPLLRELIETEFAKFEDAAWELTKKQTQIGINCNTGRGECIGGRPSDMTLYEPSEADVARAHKIAQDLVIPNWVQRCGAKCVERLECHGRQGGWHSRRAEDLMQRFQAERSA